MKKVLSIFSLFIIFSCTKEKTNNTIQGEWIQGTENQKINIIEKQFRGFDMAMIETGYRYQELYWAGQDQNWEYANYQLKKIKVAIENGLQRRPKRAKSAEYFISSVLPKMQKAIDSKSKYFFDESFEDVTLNCNNCHAMEKVSYFNVQKPLLRQSPIR